MMHVGDCHRATVEFMQAPECQLSLRTYNIDAMSFTPEEVATEIRKHLPHLKVTYNPDSVRQTIGMFIVQPNGVSDILCIVIELQDVSFEISHSRSRWKVFSFIVNRVDINK
jgi:hypothetical protein